MIEPWQLPESHPDWEIAPWERTPDDLLYRSQGPDDTLYEDIADDVKRLRTRVQAQEFVAEQMATEAFRPPTYARSLREDLGMPREEQAFIVDRLHPAGGNAMLVAEYKTGKTERAMNLAGALVDDEPFLDHFDVGQLDGRVGFWNFEVSRRMFLGWADDMGIAHDDRIVAMHWKEAPARPDLSARVWQDWTTEWLRSNEVAYWIIDTAANAVGAFGEETSNTDVARFTDTLDMIKARAGVPNLLLTVHTGRMKHAEGAERARGATRYEDWCDAAWYLSKDEGGTRSIWAMGRDVAVEALVLEYDEVRRRSRATGTTRTEHKDVESSRKVVWALKELGDGAVTKAVAAALKVSNTDRDKLVPAAERAGYIRREKDGKGLRCYLTDKGRELIAPIKLVGGGL